MASGILGANSSQPASKELYKAAMEEGRYKLVWGVDKLSGTSCIIIYKKKKERERGEEEKRKEAT